ncbi:MAG: hypothetical protein IIB10_13300 [Chloroflexi bacterium]|nr:hypothetical protein [Chloroflexota bacterium]
MQRERSAIMMKIGAVGIAILLVALAAMSTQIWENVGADEIVVIQAPFSGELVWHIAPGLKLQKFGQVTKYPKRRMYNFTNDIRFNEGGTATLVGSIQWEMPLDVENLNALHSRFHSSDAIQNQLVGVVTDKAAYMTGPLLSSTESFAERRTDLIYWVEDQVNNGTYQTQTEEVVEIDPVTGEERNIAIVSVRMGDDGQLLRQERGQLTIFGIQPFNFAITDIRYSDVVSAQIDTQQQNIMAVQTAIAQSREAEQRALTAEQQGLANAAQARAEQEVVRAREVTLAAQRLDVARLDRQSADEYRQQQILIGQGDAERRRLTMEADGALTQKLEAYVEVQRAYANAIASYTGAWVPSVVMGGNGTSAVAGGGALQLIELLGVQAARDLALDLQPRGN